MFYLADNEWVNHSLVGANATTKCNEIFCDNIIMFLLLTFDLCMMNIHEANRNTNEKSQNALLADTFCLT